jgi:hypothetical protein
MYRDWTAHWNRHEYWSQVQIRAGWVNVVGLGLERGRLTRINRLSLDGVTDVVNNNTWFDGAVSQLFDLTNLPAAFMPGDGVPAGQAQAVTRYLTVADMVDFVAQHNETEEAAEEGGEDRMETSEEGAAHPAGANPGAVNIDNGQPAPELVVQGRVALNPVSM